MHSVRCDARSQFDGFGVVRLRLWLHSDVLQHASGEVLEICPRLRLGLDIPQHLQCFLVLPKLQCPLHQGDPVIQGFGRQLHRTPQPRHGLGILLFKQSTPGNPECLQIVGVELKHLVQSHLERRCIVAFQVKSRVFYKPPLFPPQVKMTTDPQQNQRQNANGENNHPARDPTLQCGGSGIRFRNIFHRKWLRIPT